MTAENKVQAFADNFWKHASNTKGVVSLDDVYIDWANNSEMTMDEFKKVWAKIHDDINTKYGLKKADISFSRTDDILDLIKLLKDTDIDSGELESALLDKTSPTSEPGLDSELSGKPPLTPEPGLDSGPMKEPGLGPDEGLAASPPPPNDMGTPTPEGGADPELKLTESLLL